MFEAVATTEDQGGERLDGNSTLALSASALKNGMYQRIALYCLVSQVAGVRVRPSDRFSYIRVLAGAGVARASKSLCRCVRQQRN
jgi:hypothetical protein